jgi:hypothetical protein
MSMTPAGHMVVEMQMSIHWTERIGFFLFKNWNIKTHAAFFGATVFVIVLAFLLEFLPFIKQYKSHNKLLNNGYTPVKGGKTNSDTTVDVDMKEHLIDTGMQALLKLITYTLMLVVMTFNGPIIMILCLSLGIANFVFSVLADRVYIRNKSILLLKEHN